ncbi:hypothetical protein Tco_1001909 [Tanacetum coccineum]|uniref:Uncharacterized protein n=1 Tax=Tanacetum coccineum TaxID=301880 RepID=A0ABQ5F4X8_9ASTR
MISEALEDESWVDAMQEELLQFKIQKVWILIDLPYGKKAIGPNGDKYVAKSEEVLILSGVKTDSHTVETPRSLWSKDEGSFLCGCTSFIDP